MHLYREKDLNDGWNQTSFALEVSVAGIMCLCKFTLADGQSIAMLDISWSDTAALNSVRIVSA